MDMRIVGVPVIDRDPIEPGPEIALHLGDEVAGEGLEIGHLGGILRRDDEAEVMAIVMAAPREGRGIGSVLRGLREALHMCAFSPPRVTPSRSRYAMWAASGAEREARPACRTTRAFTTTRR